MENLSQMLPPSRVNPGRTRERLHAEQTNNAFADAFAVNFPQNPSVDQKRNRLMQMLVESGMPIDEAEMQAGEMLMGSQMLPVAPADLGALGRDGDTMVAHINPEEARMLKEAGGAGTINPRTGLPEFRPSGSWGKDSPTSGGRVGGKLGNTGSKSDGSRGGTVGLGSNEATRAAAFGKSAYDDIKIADPKTDRILNPNKYGGLVFGKDGATLSTGNDDLAYNDAIDKWNKRDFFDRAANFLAPFGLTSIKPNYNRPATFAGGNFHTGINPAGALVGLGAGMLVPGLGVVAGPLAGAAYDEAGGLSPVLSGPRTIYADDGTGGTARPDSPQDQTTGGNPASRDGRGTILPPIMGAPGGNPGGSALPPIAAPVAPPTSGQQPYPGAYLPIPGPTPYGWTRPTWNRY